MTTVSPGNPLSYLGVVASNPPNLIVAQRDPTSGVAGQDATYNVGTEWSNTVSGTFWILTQLVALTPTWTEVANGDGDGPITTINGVGGDDGDFDINPTANQIHITEGAAEITISLPTAITAPGSLTTTTTLASGTTLTAGTGIVATTGNIVATAGNITTTAGSITSATTVTATLGNITATNGNLSLATAGNKILIATGSNASVGTSGNLGAGGTLLVANSSVTANSKFYFTTNTLGTVTVPSAYYASARTPGTNFTILSNQPTDTSTVDYIIIN